MVSSVAETESDQLAELFATMTGDTGTPPYRLDPPPGASAVLKQVIAAAQDIVEMAFRILGSGPTTLPPRRDATTDVADTETVAATGSGAAVDEYTRALDKLETRIDSLCRLDIAVARTTLVVGSGRVRALRAIVVIVRELRVRLSAVGSGELTATQEATLLRQVSEAVEAIFDQVLRVLQVNSDVAGDGAGGGGAGAGGALGDGLGTLLQTLAALPMAAVPLLSMLPDLLGANKNEDQARDEEQQREDQATPPEDKGPQPDAPAEPAAAEPAPAPANAAPVAPSAENPPPAPNADPPAPAAPQQPDQAAPPIPAPPAVPGARNGDNRTRPATPGNPNPDEDSEQAPSDGLRPLPEG